MRSIAEKQGRCEENNPQYFDDEYGPKDGDGHPVVVVESTVSKVVRVTFLLLPQQARFVNEIPNDHGSGNGTQEPEKKAQFIRRLF